MANRPSLFRLGLGDLISILWQEEGRDDLISILQEETPATA
jgi:hypothetical protein